MISNFFVISPRGDTILAKQYRTQATAADAHERSHTEALFRKIKFWDDAAVTAAQQAEEKSDSARTGDAPPIFLMPDGLTYFHVKRNGLIFGASSARNVSPNTVLEVRPILSWWLSSFGGIAKKSFVVIGIGCNEVFACAFRDASWLPVMLTFVSLASALFRRCSVVVDDCTDIQRLLWDIIGGSLAKEFYFMLRVVGRND